jgi:hypothetical protein
MLGKNLHLLNSLTQPNCININQNPVWQSFFTITKASTSVKLHCRSARCNFMLDAQLVCDAEEIWKGLSTQYEKR